MAGLTEAARRRSIRFVHAGARAIGLDDDARRDFMERACGKRSCADMSDGELRRVCDALAKAGARKVGAYAPAGAGTYARRRGAKHDPYVRARTRALELMGAGEKGQAATILALWEELQRLGAVAEGAAIGTWMRRQGVALDHPRFCTPVQCNGLIEALKKWVGRVAREKAKVSA